MGGYLSRVAGTSIDYLRSKKVPANNTTGVKGVYRNKKGKYIARIAFQGKQYWLGAFEELEDAADARRQAEEAINNTVVEFYEKWKQAAEQSPQWANEHPIQIEVNYINGKIEVEMRPHMK